MQRLPRWRISGCGCGRYVHRVGRTGRAGRAGQAVSLVTQYDVELVQQIEEHIGAHVHVQR